MHLSLLRTIAASHLAAKSVKVYRSWQTATPTVQAGLRLTLCACSGHLAMSHRSVLHSTFFGPFLAGGGRCPGKHPAPQYGRRPQQQPPPPDVPCCRRRLPLQSAAGHPGAGGWPHRLHWEVRCEGVGEPRLQCGCLLARKGRREGRDGQRRCGEAVRRYVAFHG